MYFVFGTFYFQTKSSATAASDLCPVVKTPQSSPLWEYLLWIESVRCTANFQTLLQSIYFFFQVENWLVRNFSKSDIEPTKEPNSQSMYCYAFFVYRICLHNRILNTTNKR